MKYKGVGRRRGRGKRAGRHSARQDFRNESRQIWGMANLLESVNILSLASQQCHFYVVGRRGVSISQVPFRGSRSVRSGQRPKVRSKTLKKNKRRRGVFTGHEPGRDTARRQREWTVLSIFLEFSVRLSIWSCMKKGAEGGGGRTSCFRYRCAGTLQARVCGRQTAGGS